MKEAIHPAWFPQATVICACGNTWITGATQETLKTDICSACHPFYTGEQRIVDTEGQVDRFMKRLQVRDVKRQEVVEREASRTPMNMPLSDLELNQRYITLLADNGINTAGDFIERLEAGGENAILEISGIGRKVLSDAKRMLRALGYDLPKASDEVEAAPAQ